MEKRDRSRPFARRDVVKSQARFYIGHSMRQRRLFLILR
jgi:hypothetical protein